MQLLPFILVGVLLLGHFGQLVVSIIRTTPNQAVLSAETDDLKSGQTQAPGRAFQELMDVPKGGEIKPTLYDQFSINEIAEAVIQRTSAKCNVEALKSEADHKRPMRKTDLKKGVVMWGGSGDYIDTIIENGIMNKFQIGHGTSTGVMPTHARAEAENHYSCLDIGPITMGSNLPVEEQCSVALNPGSQLSTKKLEWWGNPSECATGKLADEDNRALARALHMVQDFPVGSVVAAKATTTSTVIKAKSSWTVNGYAMQKQKQGSIPALQLDAVNPEQGLGRALGSPTNFEMVTRGGGPSKITLTVKGKSMVFTWEEEEEEEVKKDVFKGVPNNDESKTTDWRFSQPLVPISNIKGNQLRPVSAFFLPEGFERTLYQNYGGASPFFFVMKNEEIMGRTMVTAGDSLNIQVADMVGEGRYHSTDIKLAKREVTDELEKIEAETVQVTREKTEKDKIIDDGRLRLLSERKRNLEQRKKNIELQEHHPEWVRYHAFDEDQLPDLMRDGSKRETYYEAVIWGDLTMADVWFVILHDVNPDIKPELLKKQLQQKKKLLKKQLQQKTELLQKLEKFPIFSYSGNMIPWLQKAENELAKNLKADLEAHRKQFPLLSTSTISLNQLQPDVVLKGDAEIAHGRNSPSDGGQSSSLNQAGPNRSSGGQSRSLRSILKEDAATGE